MRKVYMTITAKTMVPIVTTHRVVITCDEGVDVHKIARLVVEGGRIPTTADIEDATIQKMEVEDGEGEELSDQISAFLEDQESDSKMLSSNVDDSK